MKKMGMTIFTVLLGLLLIAIGLAMISLVMAESTNKRNIDNNSLYNSKDHLIESKEWKNYSEKVDEFSKEVSVSCDLFMDDKKRNEWLKQIKNCEALQKETDSLKKLIPYYKYNENGTPK